MWVRTQKIRRRKIPAIARVAPEKATFVNQIWTMDFVHDELHNGRKIRCLTVVDKWSREALKIEVNYRIKIARCGSCLESIEGRKNSSRDDLRRQRK